MSEGGHGALWLMVQHSITHSRPWMFYLWRRMSTWGFVSSTVWWLHLDSPHVYVLGASTAVVGSYGLSNGLSCFSPCSLSYSSLPLPKWEMVFFSYLHTTYSISFSLVDAYWIPNLGGYSDSSTRIDSLKSNIHIQEKTYNIYLSGSGLPL